MGQVSNDILEQCNFKPEQVDLVIPHQANMRIIESLAKRMKLPMEKFHNNLDPLATHLPLPSDSHLTKPIERTAFNLAI